MRKIIGLLLGIALVAATIAACPWTWMDDNCESLACQGSNCTKGTTPIQVRHYCRQVSGTSTCCKCVEAVFECTGSCSRPYAYDREKKVHPNAICTSTVPPAPAGTSICVPEA